MNAINNLTGPLVIMAPPIVEPMPSASPTEQGLADSAASDMLHQERMEYIKSLVQEREILSNNENCEVAKRLIEQELERVQNGKRLEDKRTVEVTKEKSIKVTVKVLVPVKEHPKFNFVGKLLGPKGNSLKRLQEETMTKMAILGRGSFRDRVKEEELRKNPDPKYSHLHEDLHVEVTSQAAPAEAYARIAYALTEIRRYLVPVGVTLPPEINTKPRLGINYQGPLESLNSPDHNDEIRQEQMREMQVLSGRPTLISFEAPAENHTDTSGSISPPSSLSPPPTVPIKLPTPHQIPTATAAQAAAMTPTFITHPALRGLVPSMGTPMQAATMLGRYPATIFPFGAMPGMPTIATAQPQTRTFSMYEDLTQIHPDLTQAIPHHQEFDPNLITNGTSAMADEKIDVLKMNSPLQRSRYRQDPYRRMTINVPT